MDEVIRQCKLGIYEKALPEKLSWIERLTIARDAGYDFMEISIDESDYRIERLSWDQDKINELRRAIIETNMPIWTMCLSANRRYPLGSEDDVAREYAVNIVKKAVDFSNQIGVKIIQLASYDTYYGVSNDDTKAYFSKSILEITQYASCNGVKLGFENMDTEFIDNIQKAMRYVEKMNSPWLNIYPDIGNLVGAGYSMADIELDLNFGNGNITCFHIKDAKLNTIRNVKYGDGDVDFAEFFKMLSKMNYAGLLVAEMWSDGSGDSIDYIDEAYRFIKEHMKKANVDLAKG